MKSFPGIKCSLKGLVERLYTLWARQHYDDERFHFAKWWLKRSVVLSGKFLCKLEIPSPWSSFLKPYNLLSLVILALVFWRFYPNPKLQISKFR